MVNPLFAVEFSLYSEANPSGYDDEPDFNRHCWPLIQSHGNEIDRVFVVTDGGVSRAGFLKEGLRHGTLVAADIVSVGRFGDLNAQAMSDAGTLAGEFDLKVYFEVGADRPLPAEMMKLWPRRREARHGLDALTLTERETGQLRVVAEAIRTGCIALAFRFEGTSLIALSATDWGY